MELVVFLVLAVGALGSAINVVLGKSPTLAGINLVSYQARSWDNAGAISLLIAEDGGHVGFHGKGHTVPWHERVAAEFMDHQIQNEVAA